MKSYVAGCSFCEFTSSDHRSPDAATKKVQAHEKDKHPFLSADSTYPRIRCSATDCDESIKDHYWGRVHAGEAGWFFQKNGDSWCPDHNPPWVAEWRSRKKKDAGLTRS